jgi:hypothetical protein
LENAIAVDYHRWVSSALSGRTNAVDRNRGSRLQSSQAVRSTADYPNGVDPHRWVQNASRAHDFEKFPHT